MKKTFYLWRKCLHYFTAEEGKDFNQKYGTASKEQTDRACHLIKKKQQKKYSSLINKKVRAIIGSLKKKKKINFHKAFKLNSRHFSLTEGFYRLPVQRKAAFWPEPSSRGSSSSLSWLDKLTQMKVPGKQLQNTSKRYKHGGYPERNRTSGAGSTACQGLHEKLNPDRATAASVSPKPL